jgi:endonuclease YncB( thermonuclease family)
VSLISLRFLRRSPHHLAVALLLITPTLATEFPLCGSGKRVTCVVDGDTFWLKGEKIRPEGFDAPEMGAPKCRRKAPLADAAAAELARVLASGEVAIEAHGRSYDRVLARVTVDGIDIAGPMIASGLARPYVPGSAPWCGP